jgi:hypothetical protein
MQCPNCGSENQEGAVYCQQCGSKLSEGTQQQAPPPPAQQQPYVPPAPGSYVPPAQQGPYGQPGGYAPMPGYGQPGMGYDPASVQMGMQKEKGRQLASSALTAAIVGILLCGIILEPYAIYKARQAKQILMSGESGRGKADAAEIIGWIVLVLYILAICYQVSQASSGSRY